MSYKQEAKMVKTMEYGKYCVICRQVGLEIKPYHSFGNNDYDEVLKYKKQLSKKQK